MNLCMLSLFLYRDHIFRNVYFLSTGRWPHETMDLHGIGMSIPIPWSTMPCVPLHVKWTWMIRGGGV